nr:acetyl-coenzyme A synthetase N-terminal domain-containing protein [bacterium]
MAETHTIKSMMEETRKFDPPKELSSKAWVKSFEEYKKMHDRSIADPEGFWGEIAGNFEWFKKWTKVRSYDFKNNIDIKWFEGAETNISVNCLDRHVKAGKGDRRALIWEGNDPAHTKTLTYKELLDETCKFANVLKKHGVK